MNTDNGQSAQVYSYHALRKAVGWIGILFPFVLVLGHIIIFGGDTLLQNISVYYHTGMRDLFVGAICAVALFLFFYKGYDRWDNIAANLAGFFALGIAFFPTVKEGAYDWVATVHYYAAACFFVILALISLFLFTRGEPRPSEMKRNRNVIYRACGITMLVSMAAIEIFFLFFNKNHEGSKFVLFAETVTLIAFGMSWLTKGGTLYPDNIKTTHTMEKADNLIKVFTGPVSTALLLMERLEETGVKSLTKNESNLGFLGAVPAITDLYILEEDLEKATPLLNEMKEQQGTEE